MSTRRPFRFGTGNYTARSREEYVSGIHRIEDLGYSILLSPDHFEERLAPMTALALAAEVSKTLRIGSYVFANDFRHPAILASEAATLDVLSEGRFELGIGTGYLGPDYRMTGIPLDPAGARVSRLEESVQILKGLLQDAPFTFTGTYYSISGLDGHPKPHQRPRPPLLIAGGGKRVLSLAAREADIVGLLMPSRHGALDFTSGSTAATEERVQWVRQAAADRFDELEFNTLLFGVVITDHRQRTAEDLARPLGLTGEQLLDTVHFLVGTVDQMTEDLQMWRERFGISYIVVLPEYRDALAPAVARLAGT
jgi:probable F420-dependent oxidoreductase